MSEKTRMLFGIVVICLLGLFVYIYLQPTSNISDIEKKQEENNQETNGVEFNTWSFNKKIEKNQYEIISEENIPTEIIVDPLEVKFSTGSVKIKKTKMLSNEVDLENNNYKEVTYEEFFKNSLKEYPQISEKYSLFKKETKWILHRNIDAKKYKSLWLDLYKNKLLTVIYFRDFWKYKWTASMIHKIWNPKNTTTLEECVALYWENKNCFIIIEWWEEVQFVYNVQGPLKQLLNNWNIYVLNTDSFWDWCSGRKIYNLFSTSWKKIKTISIGETWCDSVNNSFTKWDLTVEFVFYAENKKLYKQWLFQEIAVYYKNKLVDKKVFHVSRFNFDLNTNLFNWDVIEIKVWDELLSFKEEDYKQKKELKSHYWMYWGLQKTDKWYSLIWRLWDSFEYNSIANTISVLNCKDNNTHTIDEWYTLNKFVPWKVYFSYNISKEYWNYCKDGIYTIKIEVENKKTWKIDEWIADYKFDLD